MFYLVCAIANTPGDQLTFSYIDDLDSADNTDDMHQGAPPSILCVVEKSHSSHDDRVSIGLISVTPSTGEASAEVARLIDH
jgi:hypothetical protein